MKCKRHPCEDGDGVCAPCLRDRLLAVLASRAETPVERRCRTNPHLDPPPPPPPQPLPLPRPISPSITSLSENSTTSAPSAAASRLPNRFSGPQVAPSVNTGASSASGDGRRSSHEKFSILSALFGHSRPDNPDHSIPKSPRSPGSWIAAIVKSGKRKKKSKIARLFSADDATAAAERRKRRSSRKGRGLSPEVGRSAPESGYATESPLSWRKPAFSPMRRATPEHQHFGRGLAGFAMCFSPLVMSNSIRRRCQVAEMGFPGDNPRPLSPHHQRQASGGGGMPALGLNKSRKLADLGKFH